MKTAISSVNSRSKSENNSGSESHRHVTDRKASLQGFPNATLSQLEEALEERVLSDRRASTSLRKPVVERRLRQRRKSDRT